MGIIRQMDIGENGDEHAYKNKESKSFRYSNNNIIIIKVKN